MVLVLTYLHPARVHFFGFVFPPSIRYLEITENEGHKINKMENVVLLYCLRNKEKEEAWVCSILTQSSFPPPTSLAANTVD